MPCQTASYDSIPQTVAHIIASFEPMLLEADRSLLESYSALNRESAVLAEKLCLPKLAYLPKCDSLKVFFGLLFDSPVESIPAVLVALDYGVRHSPIGEHVLFAVAEQVFSLLLHDKPTFSRLLQHPHFGECNYDGFVRMCDYFHKIGRFDRAVRLYLAITCKSMVDREDGTEEPKPAIEFAWPTKSSPELIDFINKKPHMLTNLCFVNKAGFKTILEANIPIDQLSQMINGIRSHYSCSSWSQVLFEYLSRAQNEELQRPQVREKLLLIYEIAKEKITLRVPSLLENAMIIRGLLDSKLSSECLKHKDLAKPAALAKKYELMLALIKDNPFCSFELELVVNHREFVYFAQNYFFKTPFTIADRALDCFSFSSGHPDFIASLFGYDNFELFLIYGSVDQVKFATYHICDHGSFYQIRTFLRRIYDKDELLRKFISRLLTDSPRNDEGTLQIIAFLLNGCKKDWVALWENKTLIKISFQKFKILFMKPDLLNLIIQREFHRVFFLSIENIFYNLLDDEATYRQVLKHRGYFNKLCNIKEDALNCTFTAGQLKRFLEFDPLMDRSRFCRKSIYRYFINTSFDYYCKTALITRLMHYVQVWKESDPDNFAEICRKVDDFSVENVSGTDELPNEWDYSTPERRQLALEIMKFKELVDSEEVNEDFGEDMNRDSDEEDEDDEEDEEEEGEEEEEEEEDDED